MNTDISDNTISLNIPKFDENNENKNKEHINVLLTEYFGSKSYIPHILKSIFCNYDEFITNFRSKIKYSYDIYHFREKPCDTTSPYNHFLNFITQKMVKLLMAVEALNGTINKKNANTNVSYLTIDKDVNNTINSILKEFRKHINHLNTFPVLKPRGMIKL